MLSKTPGLTIATVTSLTGIPKEVLRKWEMRYGFPTPQRDPQGRRLYAEDQVARLQSIRMLIDGGMRAGQVVPLATTELAGMLAQRQPRLDPPSDDRLDALIDCLLADEPKAVGGFLHEELTARGLRDFLCTRVPVMNALVGMAWRDGRIAVRNEHLYTESLRKLLFDQIARIDPAPPGAKILLTTATGEAHTIGLLMAHAMLALEGADIITLGAGLNAQAIADAAMQYRIDIVGLSFSYAFPVRTMSAFLSELRQLLPAPVRIWAGGAAVGLVERKMPGIDVMPTLELAVEALQIFRQATAPARIRS